MEGSLILKGLEWFCRFKDCSCSKCTLISIRRSVMAKQIALSQQEEDEYLSRDECNHIDNSPPSEESFPVSRFPPPVFGPVGLPMPASTIGYSADSYNDTYTPYSMASLRIHSTSQTCRNMDYVGQYHQYLS